MEKNPASVPVAANSSLALSKPRNSYTREVRTLVESVAITAYQDFCKQAKRDCPSFLRWLKDNSIRLANLPDAIQFWLRIK